jgi:hypothetical protein
MRMDLVYSSAELKALDAKGRAALKKLGTRLVRTSPAIRDMVKKDPKIRKKLKTMMRAHYQRMKKKK